MSTSYDYARKKCLSPIPIAVALRENEAVIPLGKFHGVKVGTEFICPAHPEVHLVAHAVDAARCKARVSPGAFDPGCEVYFSRWVSSANNDKKKKKKKKFRVLLGPGLDVEFREHLQYFLSEKISGVIEVAADLGGEHTDFILRRRGVAGVDVVCPRADQSGDPLPGLSVDDPEIKEQAARTAAALAHVFRFFQIEDLASRFRSREFSVSMWSACPKQRLESGVVVQEEERVRLQFHNIGERDLYFVILLLGTGFEVRKVYPEDRNLKEMRPREIASADFRADLPKELDGKGPYRDVLRVVVFDKPYVPDVGYLCLPLIWKTLDTAPAGDGIDSSDDGGKERRITLGDKCDHTWSIEDMEIFTERHKRQQQQETPVSESQAAPRGLFGCIIS
ncbi:hypothetical protein GGR53DRAFT_526402 [Hypoxylon sp. FL1150]|nr:hypothetical protein GGR53DRAFT_526402 [Hypoxylon sp. FL1150]